MEPRTLDRRWRLQDQMPFLINVGSENVLDNLIIENSSILLCIFFIDHLIWQKRKLTPIQWLSVIMYEKK